MSEDGAAFISLAHSATMQAAEREAWLTHFSDYEIEPLFDQLNRPLMSLDGRNRDETEIADRQGWLMEFLTLRGPRRQTWLR